jgi:hypothetical protein
LIIPRYRDSRNNRTEGAARHRHWRLWVQWELDSYDVDGYAFLVKCFAADIVVHPRDFNSQSCLSPSILQSPSPDARARVWLACWFAKSALLLAGFLEGREAEGSHFSRRLCALSLLLLWRIPDVELVKIPEIWTSVPCEPSKVLGGRLWRWAVWRVEVISAIHLFQEMCCQPRAGVTLQLLVGALLACGLLACHVERCPCMVGRVYRDGL